MCVRLIQINNYVLLLEHAGYTRIWETQGLRNLAEYPDIMALVRDTPPSYLTDADLGDLAYYGHQGPLVEMTEADHDALWRDLLVADVLLGIPVDQFVSPAVAASARGQMASLEHGIDQLDKDLRGHDGRLRHDPRLLDTLLSAAGVQR